MMQAITRRRAILGSLALSAAFVQSTRVGRAQDYPTRSVRLLVGGAAGSVPDTLARVIAERLSPPWDSR